MLEINLHQRYTIIRFTHLMVTFLWVIWIQWWDDFFYVPLYLVFFLLNIVIFVFLKNLQKGIIFYGIIPIIWLSLVISRLFRPWSTDHSSWIDLCNWLNISEKVNNVLLSTRYNCIDINIASFIANSGLIMYLALTTFLLCYLIWIKIKKFQSDN